LERSQRAGDASACVRRQTVRPDQDVEIFDGREPEFDARHRLELVQRDRLAGVGLLAPEIGARQCTRDAVQ
jgi:hypothetical protein